MDGTNTSKLSNTEAAILAALLDLERAVATLKTAQPKPDLQALFQRIDQLAAALPSYTDPTFMHYMRKKSYEKARLYLQGRDGENQVGTCGHVG